MTDNEKKYAWSHLPGGKKHALEFWRLEREQPDPDDETLHQFLYVWCANASNGIVTAHPTLKGKDLSED